MNRRDALENNLVSMKEMEAQKSVTNILFYLFIVFVNHISIPKWLKIHVSLKKKKKSFIVTLMASQNFCVFFPLALYKHTLSGKKQLALNWDNRSAPLNWQTVSYVRARFYLIIFYSTIWMLCKFVKPNRKLAFILSYQKSGCSIAAVFSFLFFFKIIKHNLNEMRDSVLCRLTNSSFISHKVSTLEPEMLI